MNMKKLLPVVLSLSMLFGALPAPAFAAEGDGQGTQWSDGVWEGTGKGFGGDVGVQVTIENGAITAVTSPEHEGESFWDTYELDTLLEAIVTANSAEVDAISGATKSSNGVKEAVQLALNRAAGIPDPEPEPEKELDPTIFASGDGSESDPFVIETEEQLRAFAVSLGDAVTYDIRMKKPNGGDYLTNGALHTFEHLFATYARNSELSDSVIYVGPMGCLTGFYLILRDNVTSEEAIHLVQDSFNFVADFSGKIPGSERKECGNYLLHDLDGAKAVARDMLEVLDGYTPEKLNY